jgi:serine/threonine protein kinase
VPAIVSGMKALLEAGGRSPGRTRHRWRTAGEGHPTLPEQLAGSRPDEPGGRLVAGRFRLRSLLGRGGMGRVWLADDELLDRPVAVKQLLLHGRESAEMRAQAWACALREARAAARVDHTGAVRIYDIVQEKGWPWIVMEPLPGRTLQQALNAAGPLPVRQVTRVGLRLVDVLQATHRAGIVHRDVTPGNVHLCGGGRVVLTDFGIACTIDDASPAAGTFPGTRRTSRRNGWTAVIPGRPATCSRSARHCSPRSRAGRPSTGARCSPPSPLFLSTRRHRSCAPARCARSSKVCSPRTPDGG